MMATDSKQPTRPRGRRSADDSSDVRQNIMDAAVHHFAEKGYGGTSVRQIADGAGVNTAMIHYYFGSKLNLLLEALQQAVLPLAGALASMQEQGIAPVDNLVDEMISTFERNPALPVLMTREVLLPGGVMQKQFAEQLAPRLGGAIPPLLEREQQAGRMRSDCEPRRTALLIMALCAFPFISRGLNEPVLGQNFDDTGIELLKNAVKDLLARGLTP